MKFEFSQHGLDNLAIPGVSFNPGELDSRNLFSSGMGTPLAALTKKTLTLSLEKTFLEDQLKINLMTMIDLHDPSDEKNLKLWGRLIGLTAEYELTQDMNIIAGLTQIRGDENHPLGEAYRFNHMEDFSHLRFELKYSF